MMGLKLLFLSIQPAQFSETENSYVVMRQKLKKPVSSDILFSSGKNKWTFTIQSLQRKGLSCMFAFYSLLSLLLCGSN